MLKEAAGLFNPAFVWCFEPICELDRTLLLAQRSVAFRFRAAEHEEDSTHATANDSQWIAEMLAHALIRRVSYRRARRVICGI